MKIRPKELYAYILGLTSTFYVVMIGNIHLFQLIAIAGLIIFRIKKFHLDRTYLAYFLIMMVSIFVNYNNGYGKSMISALFVELILLLLYMQFSSFDNKLLRCFIVGLKWSCIVEIIWCIMQYILYYLWKIDINQVIFVDTLGLVSTASRYRYSSGVRSLVVTGLCWHPSNMIPVLVLTLSFFNSWYVWLICIFIGVAMHSSTAVVAIIFVLVVKLYLKLRYNPNLTKMTKGKLISIGIGLVVVCTAVVSTNIVEVALDRVTTLFMRISGATNDLATIAHTSYYTLLPEVFKNSSFAQILFGYGLACSGFAITMLNGQYSHVGMWSVETDYMNQIYGLGILGAVIFYVWLMKIFKDRTNRHTIIQIMLPILIAGVTYNILYYWVVFFVMVIMICNRKKIDLESLINGTEDGRIMNGRKE